MYIHHFFVHAFVFFFHLHKPAFLHSNFLDMPLHAFVTSPGVFLCTHEPAFFPPIHAQPFLHATFFFFCTEKMATRRPQ